MRRIIRAPLQVCGGSQSFNVVNSLRVLARWMRMVCIPNQVTKTRLDSTRLIVKLTVLMDGLMVCIPNQVTKMRLDSTRFIVKLTLCGS